MNERNPTPRLKWHMLRRRRSDAPFLRENLVAAALVLPQQAIERLDGIGSTNIR